MGSLDLVDEVLLVVLMVFMGYRVKPEAVHKSTARAMTPQLKLLDSR
jgi:hypothetical protein